MRLAIAQRITLAHGVRGGMEAQAHSLASGLIARGHEVLVLTTPHPRGLAADEEQGVPTRYVSPGTHRRYEARWWQACLAELERRHRERPFDALLSQSAGALGYLRAADERLGLPCAVVLHGSLAAELRTRLRDARTPRGLYRLARFLPAGLEHLLRWRAARRHVARWVAVSAAVAAACAREVGMPPGRVRVVHNGVDTARFRPDAAARARVRAAHGIPAGAPLLVAAGRLEREKGFQVAIQALARLRTPGARLLIAGAGPEQAALARLAAETGGAASLLGHVPNDELPALLAAADLFVLPTLREEGFPMTAAEALACGVPVLASRAGGMADAVEDGVTGALVPLGDVAALAAAADALLADRARLAAMAAQARAAAEAGMSRERMVAAVERLLAEMTAERKGPR